MSDDETSTRAMVVYCTVPEDRAVELANTVVSERLAACVNLVPGVRSIYRWQGNVCDDRETLAVLKTTNDRVDALTARLVNIHPYDCPEVLCTFVDAGHPPYLRWVEDMTRDSS